MWLMALLVNSNTLNEMAVIWQHVCMVLLSPSQNDHFKICLSTLAKLAEEMNGDPDKTNYILQNVSVTSKCQVTNTLNDEVCNKSKTKYRTMLFVSIITLKIVDNSVLIVVFI